MITPFCVLSLWDNITCVSFLSIQGSGKVFLPVLREVISLSKLENSKLDMRPESQKGKGKDERMDGWMDG